MGYISEDVCPLTITNAHDQSTQYTALIYNTPTALKLFKVHEKTNEPISGAGFSFKVMQGEAFKTLTSMLENGAYKVDENGEFTNIMVEGNGEALVFGLPLGDVWIEESVVPHY